jgi:ATP-binding cassette subfamily G (WHITE) protein 2 (SNQ2)
VPRYLPPTTNPFKYLMGALLVFADSNWDMKCKEPESAVFDTSGNQTCAEYMTAWIDGPDSRTNLVNPEATAGCRVCQYTLGRDYLYTVNPTERYYGWRNAAIFALSAYALVYLFTKLRTKASKKQRSERRIPELEV